MFRKTALLIAVWLNAVLALGQNTTISGTVKDADSGEPLISANVLYAEGQGVVTDLDGKYSFSVASGEYTIKVSYIGYEAQEQKVSAKGSPIELNFSLNTITLNEVKVVADMAVDRETPVAFTNIDPKKIQQELSSQEIPMLLNSTPGVYATQEGGGAGDARVTIRGFSQRNVSVQIDGVPMNDMEHGWVYWSNWFGLDAVTQRIQVQRGLGASKLSIPAVGGSMNILTEGILGKRKTSVKMTVGNNGLFRTNIGYNSGRMKGGWGVTIATAYDRQDGWVDQTWANRFFYFVKIQKQMGNHTLSLTAMGAPQARGQRPFKEPIYLYDAQYAQSLGADINHSATAIDPPEGNLGRRYNRHWGYVSKNRHDSLAQREPLNTRKNFYHKPIFNLKHFWAKENTAVSTIVYGSYGRGGGTRTRGNMLYDDQNQLDIDLHYQENVNGSIWLPNVDTSAVNDSSQFKSDEFIQANMNNHHWYGLISTVSHSFSKFWDLSVGVDFRSFWLEKFSTPYDLLGGDYVVIRPTTINSELFNQSVHNSDHVKRIGDVAGFRTNTQVYTGGLFGQLEFSNKKWSGFISVSGGRNWYKRSDQYRKRDLILPDTTYRIALGLNDTIVRNGQTYTHESEEAEIATTDWVAFWGGTGKAGINFNINDHMNVFANGGIFFRPPTITDVYSGHSFVIVQGIGNELVWGTEVGYSVKYPRWAANLNLYRTTWENRPVKSAPKTIGGTVVQVAIPALGAVHQGIELDAVYKTPWYFDVEGLVSVGDWRWKGGGIAYFYAEQQVTPIDTIDFDATNVKVGDAAQFQLSGSLKIKPIKGVYVKGQLTYFDNHYASFDPTTLQDGNKRRQSWRLPGYYLLDLHAGWTIQLKKMDVMLRVSMLNALDQIYISDAENNAVSGSQTFNATGAAVHIGMGRRWTASVGVKF